MVSTPVPDRLRWTVELLDVQPTDQILEIGCGHGVAASLVCERLTSGQLTAIDRSEKMIAAAERRNRDDVAAGRVAAGRAVFRTVAFEALTGDHHRFDKIFAVNVNLFWLRPIPDQLDLVKRLLGPDGALYLSYQPPGSRAAEVTGKQVAGLTPHGFTTETFTGTTATGAGLCCVVARPA